MRLRVEAEVRPTEDREKVIAAVKKIFPTIEIGQAVGSVSGESSDVASLSRLHQLLRHQAILDSARSAMRKRMRDNTTQIMLSKQVASVGRVNFTDGESPLGPIVVTLEAPNIENLIDYLAPKTRDGRPIKEAEYR